MGRTVRTIKGLGVQYYLWGEEPIRAMGELEPAGRAFQFEATAGAWELRIAWRQGLPEEGDETTYVYRGKLAQSISSQDAAVAAIEAAVREHLAAVD